MNDEVKRCEISDKYKETRRRNGKIEHTIDGENWFIDDIASLYDNAPDSASTMKNHARPKPVSRSEKTLEDAVAIAGQAFIQKNGPMTDEQAKAFINLLVEAKG